MTIRRFDAKEWVEDGEACVEFEAVPSGVWVTFVDHDAELSALTRERDEMRQALDAEREAVRVLGKVAHASSQCLRTMESIGVDLWMGDKRLKFGECLAQAFIKNMLGAALANPIAAAAVKAGEERAG